MRTQTPPRIRLDESGNEARPGCPWCAPFLTEEVNA